jgi:E3 ubiquitin-protein ligase RNF115/126
MEDFKLGEEAKKLPCKHYFHEPCILEWLKLVIFILSIKNFYFLLIILSHCFCKHGTCPVCRKNLNGEDTSQREYISRPPPPATAGAQQSETLSSSLNESTQAANPSNNDQQQQSVQETPNTSNTMTPSTSTSGHQPNPSVYQDMDFD